MKDEEKKSLLKIVVGLAIGFVLVLALFRIFSPNSATISGTIEYNGIKPDDPSQGKVVIQQRELGDTEYQTAVDNIPLEDDQTWVWEDAIEGKTYQIMAYVEHQGKKIVNSSTTSVTAPASGQNLTFNVTEDDISAGENQDAVTISGKLDLNGYVPEGSYVNILSREGNTGEFQLLAQGITAVDGRKLSWDAAQAGVYYTFRGELYNPSGINIGISDDLSIVGPANGQIIRIDSTETAPAEQTSISGTVVLNGPTQPNSTILLLQRKPGEQNYQPFDRISAVSGSSWSWDDAIAGVAYEISASLQVNEQDTSVGNVLRVTAPAEDETITINTNYSLTPPTQPPTFSCGNQQEGRWNVTLSFPSISNAAQYYLRAGTTQAGNDLLGERTSATGGNVTRNILVNDGQTNYAAYAYTFNSSCSQQQCFSGPSPTLIFKCPQ